VSAKFHFIAEQVLSLISQPERWHERSQIVQTERQMATLEVWGGGGRGDQTPTASPEAMAIGW